MNPTISADISNVTVEIHRLDGSYLAQNLAVATLVAKKIVCRGSKHPNPIKPSTLPLIKGTVCSSNIGGFKHV